MPEITMADMREMGSFITLIILVFRILPVLMTTNKEQRKEFLSSLDKRDVALGLLGKKLDKVEEKIDTGVACRALSPVRVQGGRSS